MSYVVLRVEHIANPLTGSVISTIIRSSVPGTRVWAAPFAFFLPNREIPSLFAFSG